jgi:hypothetical protein
LRQDVADAVMGGGVYNWPGARRFVVHGVRWVASKRPLASVMFLR